MTLQEKLLYHQIHPWKLAADIGCEPVSLYLLWQHQLSSGLITHFAPPIAASLLLIRYADLDRQKASPQGASLSRRMTRPVEAIRLAADILMSLAAWFHRPSLIGAGLAVIALAWCYVLQPEH